MLNGQKPSSNFDTLFGNTNLTWSHKCILDSGCSQHLCGRKDLLHNLQFSSPYVIGLPNRSKVVAVKKYTVCLGPNFTLNNVLCNPPFYYNLVNISQFMREHKCYVNFIDDCVLYKTLS